MQWFYQISLKILALVLILKIIPKGLNMNSPQWNWGYKKGNKFCNPEGVECSTKNIFCFLFNPFRVVNGYVAFYHRFHRWLFTLLNSCFANLTGWIYPPSADLWNYSSIFWKLNFWLFHQTLNRFFQTF